MFTCGSNCAGQLGLNHFDDVAVFTYVNLPTVKVHKVALGWDFTIILAGIAKVLFKKKLIQRKWEQKIGSLQELPT